MGMRVRNIMTALIFQKALRRPVSGNCKEGEDPANANASLGKIINLMSVDGLFVSESLGYLLAPLMTTMQLALCIAGLLSLLGWSAWVGLIVMVLITIIGAPLIKLLNKAYFNLMAARDDRITFMNEIVQAIRVIKFFAWEPEFLDKVRKLREIELKNSLRSSLLGMANRVIYYAMPICVSVTTFWVYTSLAGNGLTASVAFTSLSLFTMIRGPLEQFADNFVQLLNVWVSYVRIRTFLDEPELEDRRLSQSRPTGSNIVVGFEKASFSWDHSPEKAEKDESQFTLENLNTEFPLQCLSLIIGSTGSGKSSMLMALLGEMKRTSGYRYLPGHISYAAQTAWLANATIRDNITFGQAWDVDRYRRVVHACALVRDFDTLEGGDMTEVGEKGINLSGGQKQRISLARACYNNAHIILMDDPLSAVDAPTAKHIFEYCILGFLKDRTRILVTNAVSLCLARADHVVMMEKGRIEQEGSVDQFLVSVKSCLHLMSGFQENLIESLPLVEAERKLPLKSFAMSVVELDKAFGCTLEEFVLVDVDRKEKARLVQDEGMAKGRVDFKVYKLFYNAIGGHLFFGILLVGYCLNHGFQMEQDNWIRTWTAGSTMPDLIQSVSTFSLQGLLSRTQETLSFPLMSTQLSSMTSPPIDNDYYLTVYAILGVVAIISINVRLLILTFGALFSARKIHELLIAKLLKAPMRFFETTPVGRIINRFSADLVASDQRVPSLAGNTLYNMVYAIFVLGLIALVTPSFILAMIPIGYLYSRIGMYYLETSRSLKRLESVSRSPMYSHFSESISGVTTIRAFGAVTRFTEENTERIEMIGSLIVFFSGLLVVLAGADASLAGLCLTFSMSLTDTLIRMVNMVSGLENAMNSVERVQEYLELDEEAPAVIPDHRPPKSWPMEGAVQVKDLVLKYAPSLPPVLNGVSFSILPRETVGLVGRTGAGKSSLALAFYRFMEPVSGTIEIDGVDICSIGLADLRSSLTIIPQDPILFTGTVRYNLDPFGLMTDDVLWASLKRAHLVDESEKPKHHRRVSSGATLDGLIQDVEEKSTFKITLDTYVQESGSNFSQGQKQLLCLARALSRRSRVIILDEATASVDADTDARIQQSIRSEFGDSTVITIAHRLKTVMDYDKILVLDQGKVVEFGSPYQLLTQSSLGQFKSMCQETGEYETLFDIAQGHA